MAWPLDERGQMIATAYAERDQIRERVSRPLIIPLYNFQDDGGV